MKVEIEKALFEHVESLAAILSDIPVNYPNIAFDQPVNGKFLEILHLPNDTLNQVWDDENPGLNRGILRVLVHYSQAVPGTIVPNDTVDTIISHFAKGTKLKSGDVRITIPAQPSSSAAVKNDAERFIPVSIPYHTIN